MMILDDTNSLYLQCFVLLWEDNNLTDLKIISNFLYSWDSWKANCIPLDSLPTLLTSLKDPTHCIVI